MPFRIVRRRRPRSSLRSPAPASSAPVAAPRTRPPTIAPTARRFWPLLVSCTGPGPRGSGPAWERRVEESMVRRRFELSSLSSLPKMEEVIPDMAPRARPSTMAPMARSSISARLVQDLVRRCADRTLQWTALTSSCCCRRCCCRRWSWLHRRRRRALDRLG